MNVKEDLSPWTSQRRWFRPGAKVMPQNSIDLNSGHVCRETPEDFVTSTPTILIELKHSRRRDFYTKSKMSLISLISYVFWGCTTPHALPLILKLLS